MLVLVGACGGGEVAQPPDAVRTTPAVPTTVARDYHGHDRAAEVGKGLVAGASPDGSALYVSALDASPSARGCEGEPEPVLFRMPLAGDGREPVGGTTPVRGSVIRGANGRVVVAAGMRRLPVAPARGDGEPRRPPARPAAARPSGRRRVHPQRRLDGGRGEPAGQPHPVRSRAAAQRGGEDRSWVRTRSRPCSSWRASPSRSARWRTGRT